MMDPARAPRALLPRAAPQPQTRTFSTIPTTSAAAESLAVTSAQRHHEAASAATPRIVPLLSRVCALAHHGSSHDDINNSNSGCPSCSAALDAAGASRQSSISIGNNNNNNNNNPSDAEWNRHRDLITRLYWSENLTMMNVREILKQEYGFDATPRAYKFRFRKWNLRKNIKEQEAREYASGQKEADQFWAGTRRMNFERRIQRHLDKEKEKERERDKAGSPTTTVARTRHQPAVPLLLRRPDIYQAVETGAYYTNVWLAVNKDKTDWFSKPIDLGADENFFRLFGSGLDELARGGSGAARAFDDINRSFDHLKGLIVVNHPMVYMRLVNRMGSFKHHPDSEVCYRVCRLLFKHAWDLFHAIHGDRHPIDAIWQALFDVMSAMRASTSGYIEHSNETTMALAAHHWAGSNMMQDVGAVRVDRYLPRRCRRLSSPAADDDEPALRRALLLLSPRQGSSSSSSSSSNNSKLQDARLALAELLVAGDRAAEARPLVREAVRARRADAPDPERTFWLAELEWGTGNSEGCVRLLREVLAAVEAREGGGVLGPAAAGGEGLLSRLQVLSVLCQKLSVLGRKEEVDVCKARYSEVLKASGRREPVMVHLLTCDFEFGV